MKKNTIYNKEGFSVPNGYFKENKTAILKSTEPTITNKSKTDLGFSTPNKYFANSETTILKSVKPSNTSIFYKYKSTFKYGLAIAASILLLIVISTNFSSLNPNTKIVTTLSKKTETNLDSTLFYKNDPLLSIYLDDNYSEEYLDEFALEDLVFSE